MSRDTAMLGHDLAAVAARVGDQPGDGVTAVNNGLARSRCGWKQRELWRLSLRFAIYPQR
jgi:hypothetical protein